MDWLTTATESQWQKEGLIATGEDFHSEPTVTAAMVVAELLPNPGVIFVPCTGRL